MSFSKEDIQHIAKLSALEISESDVPRFQKELNEILDYVTKLQEVSSRGVPPTLHVHGETNFFRDDVVQESFAVEKIEQFAPNFSGGCFRVPKILG